VLVAAELCGIRDKFQSRRRAGDRRLAYGTNSIPKVDKLFGPGNAWVTAAKQLVPMTPPARLATCRQALLK